MLQGIGLWPAPGLATSLDQVFEALEYSGGKDLAPLALVHGDVIPPEIASGFGSGTSIIHCPRTHAWFKRPPFQLGKWLDLGMCVALGTDGEACNPDLNILSEARFLHQKNSGLAPGKVLEMATIQGARALGWDASTGTIEAGKLADLAVFDLENPIHTGDPVEALMGQENGPQKVLWRGAWR